MPKPRFHFLLVLITCFTTLISTSQAAIIIKTHSGTEVVISAVQILYRDNPMEPITSAISSTYSTNMDDAFNKTLVLPIARTMDDVAVMAQEKGAVAFIGLYLQGFVPGMSKFRISSKEATLAVRIPIFSVAGPEQHQLSDLLSRNEVTSIEIVPEDPHINPWDEVFLSGGVIAGNVMLYGANVGLTVWKIVVFGQHHGAKLSIALVVLTCELAANLLRIFSGIDPFGQNYIYYNEQVGQGLGTSSYPFAVSAFLLLALYWHQMVTAGSLKVASFLTKMKIPFFVIAAALVVFSVLANILYATTTLEIGYILGKDLSYTNVTQILTVPGIIYTAILGACIVFYAVAGGMVLKRLALAQKRGKTVRLHRVTIQILVSGACYLTFMLTMVLGSVGLFPTPIAFTLAFGATSTALGVASLLNILSFETANLMNTGKSNYSVGTYSVKSRANTITGDAPYSYGAPAASTNTPAV